VTLSLSDGSYAFSNIDASIGNMITVNAGATIGGVSWTGTNQAVLVANVGTQIDVVLTEAGPV
jgi:hypothetical protein